MKTNRSKYWVWLAVLATTLSACAKESDIQSKQVEIRLAQDAYDGSTSLIEFEMERILKNETILAEDQISVDNNISGYVHIEENDLKLLVYVENMNDLPEFAKEKLVKEIKSEISARRTLAKENPNWPIVEILYYHITYKSDHIAGLVFEEWSRGEGSKVDPVAFAQTKIWVSDSSKLPKAIYSEDGAELYSWIDIYKTAEAEQAIAAYILPKFKTCLQKDQFYSASQRQEALSKDNVWESQGRHYFYRTSLLPSTKKNKIGGLRFHLGTALGEANAGFYAIDIPHEIFSKYLIEDWSKYFDGEMLAYQSNALQRICRP